MAEVQLITSTPILGKIRPKGATFYTFSSALNDLDWQRMNQGVAMSPSKFVCLKLPNWQNPGDNPDFQTIFVDPTLMQGTTPETDPNICFPKVMQNYMENMLQYAYKERKDQSLASVAELSFWKMLKHTKALQLEECPDEQFTLAGKSYQVYKERAYTEDDQKQVVYDPVVKYVGDINILNNIDKEGQVYTEIMMYIPTNGGSTNNIRFVDGIPEFNNALIPDEYAEGSEEGLWSVGLEDHQDELSKAVYDTDNRKYEVNTALQRASLWFDAEIMEPSANQFYFNAILVYYDIWNMNDPSTKTTNLMGILFMNDMDENSAGVGEWQNYEKLVQDENGAGNSYVFRINLKNTNSGIQVDTEVTVNDYDTVSMALYLEAIKKLNDLNQLYTDLHEKFLNIVQKTNTILSAAALLGDASSIVDRVTTLERQVAQGVDENQISTEEMMEMLQTTNQTIVDNPEAVVVFNKFTGNPIYKDVEQPDGTIKHELYVVDPHGEVWHWNEDKLKWEIETE